MTVKPSGSSLSFGEDIVKEFGLPPGKNLGAYRLNGGITVSGLEKLALDNEVNSVGIITPLMPREGTIKFSDFYGKKLNVVVDYTVATGYATRKDYSTARGKYNAGSNTTILGFALKTEAPDNMRVWIHTNGDIGSDQAASEISTTYCSLLTGTWSATTDLRLDVGTSGNICGAGGNGGKGGDTSGKGVGGGSNGLNGSSALGIQHTPIIIINRGKIVAGGGGGGGGSGAYDDHEVHTGWGNNKNRYYYASAPGSGGGGGRGLPGGTGGPSGTSTWGNGFGKFDDWNSGGRNGSVYYANAGNDGSSASAGIGGTNVTYSADGCSATGNYGGDGGNGVAGSKSGDERATGGSAGYAIIISNDGTGVTYNNVGIGISVGNTVYNTTPK